MIALWDEIFLFALRIIISFLMKNFIFGRKTYNSTQPSQPFFLPTLFFWSNTNWTQLQCKYLKYCFHLCSQNSLKISSIFRETSLFLFIFCLDSEMKYRVITCLRRHWNHILSSNVHIPQDNFHFLSKDIFLCQHW